MRSDSRTDGKRDAGALSLARLLAAVTVGLSLATLSVMLLGSLRPAGTAGAIWHECWYFTTVASSTVLGLRDVVLNIAFLAVVTAVLSLGLVYATRLRAPASCACLARRTWALPRLDANGRDQRALV